MSCACRLKLSRNSSVLSSITDKKSVLRSVQASRSARTRVRVDCGPPSRRIPAYTVELRPRGGGSAGFEIGAEHIVPAGDEITAGTLALVSGVLQEREMDGSDVGGGSESAAAAAAATHSPEGVAKSLACNRQGGPQAIHARYVFARRHGSSEANACV